jgi:hypothetical protein
MITHQLERFPEHKEEVCFDILDEKSKPSGKQLCFTVIEIHNDTKIGKVEVTVK